MRRMANKCLYFQNSYEKLQIDQAGIDSHEIKKVAFRDKVTIPSFRLIIYTVCIAI